MVAKLKVDQLETVDGTGIITANNQLTAPSFAGDGSSLTALDATALTGNLPAIDGSSLTGVGVAGISSSADATAITINSSEQVGIGTGSPTSPLHVLASSAGQTVAKFESNQAGAVAVEIDADADRDSFLRFQEAGTNRWDFFAQGSSGTNELNIRNESGTNLIQFKQDGRGLSQFTAKAWGNVNQSAPQALRDSHNISSITDVATGKTRFTFANAMADTNYACVASIRATATEAEHVNFSFHATGSVDIFNTYRFLGSNAVFVDSQQLTMVTFGD